MTPPSFFDLVKPDMVLELGSHTFERDEIIKFATKFDPQRFHLSEEAAATSIFGALCASGWHTVSVWMRQNVLHGRDELVRLTGYDGPPPIIGPSPGVRNVRWTLPVFVGDTITYRATLTGKRPTAKQNDWGLLTNHSQGFNQDGKQVLAFDGAVMVKMI